MGIIDKFSDKVDELSEKAEKTYNEAITPEYREKISRGIDKLDKGLTKAVDCTVDKVTEIFSGDKK